MHLAQSGSDEPVRAAELAEAAEVPPNYMGKILHSLVRAGILRSVRGKLGGFELAIPADQLSLRQIVSQFDDLREGRKCLLGRDVCSDDDPCPTHERWGQVSERIDEFFGTTTVADLMDQPRKPAKDSIRR
ncbi:MAG: Rrf2 family transcriptional regulator [Gemmatimonadota bacterium]|nr:MAG: Rrf2 family transcriptional regulator [Gemmatimonadota bacterium]